MEIIETIKMLFSMPGNGNDPSQLILVFLLIAIVALGNWIVSLFKKKKK